MTWEQRCWESLKKLLTLDEKRTDHPKNYLTAKPAYGCTSRIVSINSNSFVYPIRSGDREKEFFFAKASMLQIENVLVPLGEGEAKKEGGKYVLLPVLDRDRLRTDRSPFSYESWRLVPAAADTPQDGLQNRLYQDALLAADLVNIALSRPSRDKLWALFGRFPFGWKIGLMIDTNSTLRERMRIAGSDFDVLGFYAPDDRSVTLFALAVWEYLQNVLKAGEQEFAYCCAHVLSHEMFHALQDFEVNLSENPGRVSDPLPNDETFAEFFALRYAEDVLHDTPLFTALCRERKKLLEKAANNCYAKALNQFGDITNEESRGRFLTELKSWRQRKLP